MNHQEYWTEIAEIAKWASDNRPTELGGKGLASEYGEGFDQYDALHETLDGHQWVIYTHKARSVIAHTNNPNALMEEFGSDVGGDMFDERRAFCAMMQDIIDAGGMDQDYDLDDIRRAKADDDPTFTEWSFRYDLID